ncbi:hypothetical protein B7494_g1987 [Chlorociboria aeruginascens]|nr:hypothetical protein B7494_g1987 [Chlorociboria aeruginascens]
MAASGPESDDTDTLPLEESRGHVSKHPASSLDDKKDTETNPNSTSDSLGVLEEEDASSSAIIYHYLTFETPSPNSSTSPLDALAPVPPPRPNLKKYTSPFLWSDSRKSYTTWLSCIATAITAYTAGSYAPAAAQMSLEWGVSDVAILVGITTFCCGIAIAPMILAPFSEIQGRYPVFIVAGLLYLVSQIGCAITRSYPGMLVARFFTGCGSSVFSSMVGGVISDIYHTKHRNTPMALFSGAALFGTGVGPLVSGFVAQNTSWRWVFWIQVIVCSVLMLAVTMFLKETWGNILLSRKAQCLNKWYEEREKVGYFDTPRIRWKVKSDEERESISKMIGISVYRPFHLLLSEPVVFFFSLSMDPEQQRLSSGQFIFEDIEDSVFINFAESVDNVSRKLSAPVRRGARANNTTTSALGETLKGDMAKLICSPLSQLWMAQSVPGMSSAQVEALRKLYASVKNESNPDNGWEAALETAVKLMQPSNATKAAVESANNKAVDNNQYGPSMPLRRSDRLASLPNVLYKEGNVKEDTYTTDLLNEAVLRYVKELDNEGVEKEEKYNKKVDDKEEYDDEEGYIKKVDDEEVEDEEEDNDGSDRMPSWVRMAGRGWQRPKWSN